MRDAESWLFGSVSARLKLVACLVGALLVIWPVWTVRYLPIQDLAMHLSAIRVIHSLHDLRYGLESHFELTFGKTQYLLFYVAGDLLSYLAGVRGAGLLLLSFYLGGTVLGTASLARALGKDPTISLLTIPFIYNCSLIIGFLPFLIGIPILLFSLAAAVRYVETPTRLRAVPLVIATIALFYSHIVTYAFFGVGFAMIALLGRERRARTLRGLVVAALPVIPSVLMCLEWAFFTEAGRVTREVATQPAADAPWAYDRAIREVYQLAFDIFRDQSDETIFFFWVALVITCIGLAQGDRNRERPAARVLFVLPVAALYLFLHSSHRNGYVAHIKDRFPILFIFSLIPLLRMPRGARGWACIAGALALDVAVMKNVSTHFSEFETEVGGLDGAIATMDPRARVAALIYDNGSRVTTQSPFLHFGLYYQVEKGGVVQFTFAGYPHWPYRFKDGASVPSWTVDEGWCWGPQGIRPEKLYPSFDYVLTRGHSFSPPPGSFDLIFRDARWDVWKSNGATESRSDK